MTHDSARRTGDATRRTVLKMGGVVASGLAVGGTAIGTAGANRKGAMAELEPEHFFVRAMGADDPDANDVGGDTDEHQETSPVPAPDDKIVERRMGNPVDTGTKPSMNEGPHLTWGEFSDLDGHVNIRCTARGHAREPNGPRTDSGRAVHCVAGYLR